VLLYGVNYDECFHGKSHIECHYTECYCAKCHLLSSFVECRIAQCYYVECHHALSLS